MEAIRRYESEDGDGRLGLYFSVGMKPNSAELFLSVKKDSISVRSKNCNSIAKWELAEIEMHFNAKVKNLLLVKVSVEIRDGE